MNAPSKAASTSRWAWGLRVQDFGLGVMCVGFKVSRACFASEREGAFSVVTMFDQESLLGYDFHLGSWNRCNGSPLPNWTP